MSVSDKTVVITGAGSKRGIGRATAHTLAAAGWNVAILDLDEASAKDAAHEVAERNRVQAVGVGCDITDEASVENALAVLDGALPTLHDRYGLSTDAVVARVRDELSGPARHRPPTSPHVAAAPADPAPATA